MKKKTIMEYSDFKTPFLKITVFDGKGEKNELVINFSEYEIESGEIIAPRTVVSRIKEAFDKIYPVELLLSCEEIYKSVFSFPKMSKLRAETAYRKQLKDMQRDDYTVIEDFYVHSIGCVFNSYFVPNRIVNCLKKIVRDLGTHVEIVRLFGMYLKEQLNYKKDYVYFYIRKHLCRMMLVVENRLVTEYDFSFENTDEIQRRFLMVVSKHEFEFERKKISHYGLDSDVPLEMNLGLNRVDLVDAPTITDNVEIEYDDPLDDMTNNKPTTFEQRLNDCPEYVKKRYGTLSEDILAYRDMECMTNEVCSTFFVQSKIWFKIDIDKKGEGKRISLYFADNPQNFAKRKIQFAISKKHNFLSTPCLLRISTNARFVLARQIIRKFMAENQVSFAGKDNMKEKTLRQTERIKQINARREKDKAEKEQAQQPAEETPMIAVVEEKENLSSATSKSDAEATVISENAEEVATIAQLSNEKKNKQKEKAVGRFGLWSKKNEKKADVATEDKTRLKNKSGLTQDVETAASQEESLQKNSEANRKTKESKKLAGEQKPQNVKSVNSTKQSGKAQSIANEKNNKQKSAQQAKQQQDRAKREKIQQAIKEKNQKTQAALNAQKAAKKKK